MRISRKGRKMKETTLNDVLAWIALNCDDTNSMNKINKISYQFTSKFVNQTGKTFEVKREN